MKVKEENKKGKPVLCALMMDEMNIRKHAHWDGNQYKGLVDDGMDFKGDNRPLATEALVFLLVSLNDSWKLPCGYFLLHGISGIEKANLVTTCLEKINDTGATVVSFTCDGLLSNWCMFEELGAQLRAPASHVKPWFDNPARPGQKIFILFDACHMLKLLRNALGKLHVIKDGDGGLINWFLIKALHEHQEREGLRAGNRLRLAHTDWESQKMKVHLAAQTISSSVADALEFCQEDLGLKTFSGSGPLVKFLRLFDRLFDILNSRNPLAKNFKAPLRWTTRHLWTNFFASARSYILGLTDSRGIPLVEASRKAAFVGFLINMSSLEGLCSTLLGGEAAPMNYLLTYKLSQDHLELFFCAIRSRGGWNNNPTVGQFKAAYKRLLVHHEVEQIKGNCSVQDETSILFVGSGHKTLGTFQPSALDVGLSRRLDIAMPQPEQVDHDYADVPDIRTLSLYVDNVVVYIAGYVVRMMKRHVTCPECLDGLSARDDPHPDVNMRLLQRKNRGGLQIPCNSIVVICKSAECCIRRLEAANISRGGLSHEKGLGSVVVSAVLCNVANSGVTIFPGLQQHMFDSEPTDNHVVRLMRLAVCCYVKIRMSHQASKVTEQALGQRIRSRLSHSILFQNQ